MKSFPLVNNQEVIIIWSEASTGIVLDKHFKYALNDDEVFTIIKSFEEALELANSILNERENVECVIYNSNQEVLKYLQHFNR